MPVPRYTKEEATARGAALFTEKIESQVKDLDPQLFVAINIETGEFVVDANSMAATKTLLEKDPDAQIFMRRVGFPYTYRLGTPRPKKGVTIRRVTP